MKNSNFTKKGWYFVGGIFVILILAVLTIEYQKDNLNGRWVDSQNHHVITIDTDKHGVAVWQLYSWIDGSKTSQVTQNFTIDKERKEIIWTEPQEDEKNASYDLVKGQLIVTLHYTDEGEEKKKTFIFEKNAKFKVKVQDELQDEATVLDDSDENRVYNFDGDYNYLDLGDYEIGTDLKPGKYMVSLTYRNEGYSAEKGTGKIVVTSDAGTREYQFVTSDHGYSEDQRLVLKKGDIVTLSSEGAKSEFEFNFEED
ncbi:hypothetical protein M2139_001330 [Enterococcus sp. PF1-24]|uniref:hypothetical protein n=1 Tax=unclassified Enterococcus TaxID=2608891 RepID=UPI002473DCE5|nr:MULTISPECIES: hypothetical protein [unclassified Enterococcus]MDH6364365.1 hypothetical protein [Enterococcus sp. PFB1-1]MDH6401446.1 hypothetical protein [Enterococcus sp. PF1-24]